MREQFSVYSRDSWIKCIQFLTLHVLAVFTKSCTNLFSSVNYVAHSSTEGVESARFLCMNIRVKVLSRISILLVSKWKIIWYFTWVSICSCLKIFVCPLPCTSFLLSDWCITLYSSILSQLIFFILETLTPLLCGNICHSPGKIFKQIKTMTYTSKSL